MYVALLRISDEQIVARDEFTKEELHQAIDGEVQLFRVDADGVVEFYDPEGGCWTQLETVVTRQIDCTDVPIEEDYSLQE